MYLLYSINLTVNFRWQYHPCAITIIDLTTRPSIVARNSVGLEAQVFGPEVQVLRCAFIMSRPTILDLPAELLDRVYSYLDWDRTISLTPEREDIFNISLACKHLRDSILPLVFRNVRLSLRWIDGELIEPSLFRLRRHHPELAQHVRCVHIDTKHGHYYGRRRTETPFRLPEESYNWLNPELAVWSDSRHYLGLNAVHRERIDEVVRTMCGGVLADTSELLSGKSTAEAMMCSMLHAVSRGGLSKTRTRPASHSEANASAEYPSVLVDLPATPPQHQDVLAPTAPTTATFRYDDFNQPTEADSEPGTLFEKHSGE